MGILEAIALGIVQGLTEFLPVSSSGHLVLMQKIFGTAALEGTTNPQLLFFDTMLHIGTLIAVVIVLWKDIWGLFKKPFNTLLYLIVATIPAVIFALFLNDFIESAFGGQYLGYAFLFTALLLTVAELIAKRVGNRRELRLGSAAVMGVMQAVAILPGISRSGSTLAGGLACGVERQKTARFAFLMSIPAILGAALLNGYTLTQNAGFSIDWAPLIAGMVCAAITGYIAIRFMLALIGKKRLWGFAIYVAAVGTFVLLDQYILHTISWQVQESNMLDFSMEPYKKEMIETLKGFIRIESVKSAAQPNMPYGKGIFDALMYVQSTAERMDLDCVNAFGHLAYVDYGYGDEMLGILVHVDVVPKGEEWTMPAFEGIEKDGRIYGRGAIDNKGPAIAALYAIKALSDNCIQLNKKVRLIFGADEETTWTDMDYYKEHEQIPDIAFSPDGEYPVINVEKGVIHIELNLVCPPTQAEGVAIRTISSGTSVNVVPNRACCVIKAPFDIIQKSLSTYVCPMGATLTCEQEDDCVRISAAGKSAHGSRPEEGINAAASLLLYLNTLPLASGVAESAVYALAQKIGGTLHGENMELDLCDEPSGQLTLNLGYLRLRDGAMKVGLDVRYPVSFTRNDVDEKVKKHLGMFEYRCIHAIRALHVPEDSELISTLGQVYKDNTGEEPYCIAIGGATYARAFDNAVTFGPLFPGQPSVEHGPDEYADIASLVKNAEIIADAIMRLCGSKA